MSILARLLKEVMEREDLSEREVARRTGLSNTTVNSALKGEPVSINSLLAFARFLNVAPSVLLDGFLPEINDLHPMVYAIIQRDPELARLLVAIHRLTQSGKATMEDFKEALRYLAYRLNIDLREVDINEATPANTVGENR